MKRFVDLRTQVGSVALPNPVLTASGTAGHGAELAAYVDLGTLGAVVVKSLAAEAWPGNRPPRVHETPAGMLNSVGLQGPGVQAWIQRDLHALNDRGARVVASIWGRRVEDYGRAAEMLAGAPGVVAVEVNVSCPNTEDRSRMFAHSAYATAQAVSASAACGFPLWAKLSPNVADIVDIAGAALEAGAETLVLVNTVLGMAIDTRRRTYRLGSGPGGGGLSGPAIRPVAVRAVHDCRAAFPYAGIVGVGGVSRGVDAAELLMAGADAVEVGTATFRDPRAPARVLAGLVRWCRLHDVADVRAIVGAVHAARLSGAHDVTSAPDDTDAHRRAVVAEAQWQVARLDAEAARRVRPAAPAPEPPVQPPARPVPASPAPARPAPAPAGARPLPPPPATSPHPPPRPPSRGPGGGAPGPGRPAPGGAPRGAPPRPRAPDRIPPTPGQGPPDVDRGGGA